MMGDFYFSLLFLFNVFIQLIHFLLDFLFPYLSIDLLTSVRTVVYRLFIFLASMTQIRRGKKKGEERELEVYLSITSIMFFFYFFVSGYLVKRVSIFYVGVAFSIASIFSKVSRILYVGGTIR